MNPYERNFYISSATFSEYKVTGDIRYLESINDIINLVKTDLLTILEKHNFIYLIEKCKEADLHIHTHSFDEILIANPNDKIYICEGCDNPQK